MKLVDKQLSRSISTRYVSRKVYGLTYWMKMIRNFRDADRAIGRKTENTDVPVHLAEVF